MTETKDDVATRGPTPSKRVLSRRLVVGLGSVAVGLVAMAVLVTYRDRIKMRGKESECGRGNADVCLIVADAYAQGAGVKKDRQLAMQFQRRAVGFIDTQCRAGDPLACYRLGVVVREWRINADSCVVATEAFERGCDGGHAKSCISASGSCGGKGADLDRVAVFLSRACMAGDDGVCLTLGTRLTSTGNGREAIPLLGAACERNHGTACYELAELCRGRAGVDVNLERSFAYAARSAALLEGDCSKRGGYWDNDDRARAHPCGMLANLLDTGRGVARDLTRVRDLWRTACDAGDERACEPLGDERGVRNLAIQKVELGTPAQGRHACERGEAWSCYREAFRMLREGNEVTGDPRAVGFFFARASTLFGEACERGEADACRIAGDLRKVGLGFPRDVAGALRAYDKAARLEHQACDTGDAERCAKLANMYADGRAVAADPKRAVETFDRAKALLATSCNQPKASDASRLACDRLDRLLREGTVVPPVVSLGTSSPSATPR